MKNDTLTKELAKLYTLAKPQIKEVEDTLLSKEEIELATLREELASKRQDREQRRDFALYIFIMMCTYLFVVLIVVILKGCTLLQISDIVMNVLLSTTTANVIGIFIIVAKYLFHH